MYTSPFKGEQSIELGHSNYQHPLRRNPYFYQSVDNFSAIVIYLSLCPIAFDPTLFDKYNSIDNIILQKPDHVDPRNSTCINRLKKSSDITIRYCTEVLVNYVSRDPLNFSGLELIPKSL